MKMHKERICQESHNVKIEKRRDNFICKAYFVKKFNSKGFTSLGDEIKPTVKA